MKNIKSKNMNLQMMIFATIFCLTNVSHASIFSRAGDAWSAAKKAWRGGDSEASSAARDARRSADTPNSSRSGNDARSQNPNTVTENADGAVQVRMSDFITKVRAKADVEGADYFSAQVARILMRKSKAAPITVAEAGTGKSANIQYLQHLIDTRNPMVRNLHDKEIYFLDIYKLMGGTELRGSFEKKLASILEEMALPENSNKIIVIDELENVLGNELGAKFLESMKSYLTSDMNTKLIFNITPGPYDKLMKDPQLVRRMSPIYKDAPTRGVVRKILLNIKKSAELIDGVSITNEQVEQILRLSETHPTLRNPDVAITMINDAINNAVADRGAGSLQIVKLRSGLDTIEGEIAQILGMRSDGSAKAFGPHFDAKLERLLGKKRTIETVINGYDQSFRATEVLRNKLESLIAEKNEVYNRARANVANRRIGDLDPDLQIDDINTQILEISQKIQDENPLLVARDLQDTHVVSAAMTILNKDERYVSRYIDGPESRQAVVDRIAEPLYGRHKQAVSAIVRREAAQRRLGEDGGIPAFLILNKSGAEADRVANAVITELTGAKPYRIDGLEIKGEFSMNQHIGSDGGTVNSDKEGALFEQARKTGGHFGMLFSGVQNGVSHLLDFAERVLKNPSGQMSNKGDRTSFARSVMILTESSVPELDQVQKAIYMNLRTETARQNFLKEHVLEHFRFRLAQGQFDSDSARMSTELIDKLHVIYLDEGVMLDDQFKAVIAETLKSRTIRGALDRSVEISTEFSDEAIDYLFNILKQSGSNDINRVLVNEVMTFVDDLIQNQQVVSGDLVQIGVDRNRLAATPTDWTDRSKRSTAIQHTRSLSQPSAKPAARKALEDALKLIED